VAGGTRRHLRLARSDLIVLAEVLFVVSFAIFVYFVVYTIVTFTLIVISLVEVSLMKIERGEIFTPPHRLRRPGISLVAPAYNMEATIVPSVRSLLASDYEPLELVVVDDGSGDGTTAVLTEAFDLVEIPVGDRLQIPTAPIEAMYVSRIDPRLRVVRKENGGRSDAINAGLNLAYTELVALVDADTILEPDALKRVGEVFALEPDDTVAVGGTIRILNGALLDGGTVVQARVAQGGIEASQTAEYLRGFLGGRIAWSWMNGLLIISGAFGVFDRDLLRRVGGLSKETLGEDMEIVMRLHHLLRPDHPQARIAYAPDANAWTEIPTALRSLRTQRIRWHVGLLDNLDIHRAMVLRRRFGAVGTAALPYTLCFEVLGPLLQVAGYAILAMMILLRQVHWVYAVSFFVITLLVGQLQTAGALLIEEAGFRRYRVRDLMRLAAWSLLELLWYRPITAVWRVWGTVLFLVGRRPDWGTIPRGVALRDAEEPVSAPLTR
jgi:cellulose synthase/poly-beta-1,6-N-acetylglucosamine synthase-like glycosyltransferase